MSNTALKISLVGVIIVNVILAGLSAANGYYLLMLINIGLAMMNGYTLGRAWDL